MTVFATIRNRRHSASVLGLALLAWSAILVAPCAMAFAAGDSADQTHGLTNEPSVGVHADCPNIQTSQALLVTGCCCDLSDVLKSDPPEPSKFSATAAIVVSLGNEWQLRRMQSSMVAQYWLPHATSPPVYLATQRLRI